jgi:putative MATE family efflux protein
MANNSFSRVVWKVSLPIILVEATETFNHLIDTLFLAHVGVTELGALAVADSVLLIFLILPLSMVDGLQILTARRVGQRRPDAVGAAFNQGFLLVMLLSLISMVALKFTAPLIAEWLVESPAVGEAINSYLQIDAYSIPLAGATFALSALLTSLNNTRALIPATTIVITLDVVLNYLFIFGKFGFPAMGMRGAAIGSIGAELAATIFLLVYVGRRYRTGRYGFFRFRALDYRIHRLLARLSGPIAALDFLEDLRWFIFFLIIERVSIQELAIANIVYTCYIVFWIPAEGFAETACSMVSRFVGRNRSHRIGQVLRSTTGGAIIATLPFIILALAAPQWLASFFASKGEVFAGSDASLRVIGLAMLIGIPGQMWLTAVESTGDTAAALGIDFIATLVMLGMTYLAAIHLSWPIAWVWLAIPITWLFCLTISYGWIKSGIWKRLEV